MQRFPLKAFTAALLLGTVITGTAHAQTAPRPTFGDGSNGAPAYARQAPANNGYGGNAYNGGAYNGGDAALGADDGSAQRSAEQAQGNYAPLPRNLGLPLGTTQDAWSQPQKSMAQGQVAPGVVRFTWSQDLIMPIRIREFMVTMIVLPDWERVSDVWIGESQYMQARLARPNVVAFRSGASGIDTNLTVVGETGNIYTFYVRAESYNTKRLTDLNVFVTAPSPAGNSGWFHGGFNATAQAMPVQNNFTMPAPMSAPQAAPSAPTHFGRPDFSTGEWSFVHKMFEVKDGDRQIAPELVYSDQRGWTYFDFRDKASQIDMPIVYRIVDGVETRVNVRSGGDRGEILIAEANGDFVLRNGDKTVCIIRIKDGEAEVASPDERAPGETKTDAAHQPVALK